MKIIVLTLVTFLFVSCGTTHIVVKNKNADIFVDNQYAGKGHATVTRVGPPNMMFVDAKVNGEQIGSTFVHREFCVSTFIAGICTYGIGFYVAWKYPENVEIPIREIEPSTDFSAPKKSPWDISPSQWKK